MSGDDPRAKAAQKLIVEAKRLHDGGKHADSIATAEKAARVLGVQLEAGPDDAGAGKRRCERRSRESGGEWSAGWHGQRSLKKRRCGTTGGFWSPGN